MGEGKDAVVCKGKEEVTPFGHWALRTIHNLTCQLNAAGHDEYQPPSPPSKKVAKREQRESAACSDSNGIHHTTT
jgi:hypothetical protein